LLLDEINRVSNTDPCWFTECQLCARFWYPQTRRRRGRCRKHALLFRSVFCI